MAYYVRKFNRGKWPKEGGDFTLEKLSADAITCDLKTTKNTLSLWRIESLDDIDKAILAIAGNLEHLDTIDVIVFNEDFIKDNNIELSESSGITAVENLANTHRDIANLTYLGLGNVAAETMSKIEKKDTFRRTGPYIKRLLKEANEKGQINMDKLKEGVKSKL